MNNSDLSLFPISSQVNNDDQLLIDHHNLVDLADQYGTPLYIYDAATIQHQTSQVDEVLNKYYPANAMVTYAAKAYFSATFAQKLCGYHVGVDVVSLNEMKTAKNAGFPKETVHLHGNNKSYEEIEAALTWGIQSIVVDSLDELDFLTGIAAKIGCRARIWLRITPDLDVNTHPHIHTSHSDSKFGLHIRSGDASTAIRKAISSQWLELTGLHTHLGSQIFQENSYREAIDILYELTADEGYVPQEISPGGGWGVRYVGEQEPAHVDHWVRTVSQAVMENCSRYHFPFPKLVLEPGRWLAAKAGVVCYRVGSQKVTPDGTCVVAVDGGLADNPRVALYQSRYTARVANRMNALPIQKKRIVGKFCESGDVLISEVMLPDVKRGDLLVVPVAGAYQLSMSSNYNLANRPAVLWLEGNQVEVLQDREEMNEASWWASPRDDKKEVAK